jgi:AcrR family transcriptional regulator
VLNFDAVAKITERRAYKKREASREQVLDAAIAVLAEKGVAATSVQDIADGAGLSKGAVHYHFESKDELLVCVLERCCEVMEVRVRAVFAEPGLPLERADRALGAMWSFRRDGVPEMRVLTQLHGLSSKNENVQRALREALARARQQIIDVGLTELIALGIKPKVPIEVIPRLLLATLDGLAMHREVDPFPPAEEAAVIQALETVFVSLFEL